MCTTYNKLERSRCKDNATITSSMSAVSSNPSNYC